MKINKVPDQWRPYGGGAGGGGPPRVSPLWSSKLLLKTFLNVVVGLLSNNQIVDYLKIQIV